MSIECSHCGAMNPAGSTFCGECGWQIMPQEVELEIERAITIAQRKADPDAVKAGPEVGPASSEAGLEPEPVAISTEPEAEGAEFEAGLDGEPSTIEVGPEPEPVAISAEPEVEGVEFDAGPDVELATIEVGSEPKPVAISVGPEAEPADLDVGQEAAQVPMPAALPTPAKPPYAYGEGVAITGSAAILGDRTYAWGDIISVTMETSRAHRLPSLLLAAFGAIILALAGASLGRDSGLGLILIVGGLGLLVIGAILAVTARDQYMVCVETASGVEAALVSADREYVQRTVQALSRGPSGEDLPQQG